MLLFNFCSQIYAKSSICCGKEMSVSWSVCYPLKVEVRFFHLCQLGVNTVGRSI